MPSSGRISLNEIKAALSTCLPGCRWDEGPHKWCIYPPGGGFPFYMPKGEHGMGWRAEIERGHIRKMARQFGVLDKLKEQLPAL